MGSLKGEATVVLVQSLSASGSWGALLWLPTLIITLTLQKHLLIYVSVHCLIYVFLGLYVCFFLTGATMCILNL